MKRIDVIRKIMNNIKDELIICSTGMISREVYEIKDRPENFYVMGSMGASLGIGLGLALHTNKKVIVLAGDGDISAYVDTTDSLEALRDHVGDGTNLTEAGGDGDHLTEAGATGNHLSAIPWNSSWDAEVQSEVQDAIEANNLDHLAKTACDSNDITNVVTDQTILAVIMAADGDISAYDDNTDSLEAIRVWVGDGTNLTEAGGTGNHLTDLGGMSTTMKGQVNTECKDIVNTDTYAEPGQGAPAATTSLAAKINYLYKAWRNKATCTDTTLTLYADDGTTTDQVSTVSEAGGTVTRGEMGTGA